MTQALLLSASRVGDTDYLAHALPYIARTLGNIKQLLFVPYAGVSISYDDYSDKVAGALKPLGIDLVGLHTCADPVKAVKEAQAIAVGGGNTFALLHQLYQLDLIAAIKEAYGQGTPYIGWSAGANIAGASIRTTNDMPIIQPPSFDALGLVPCQLNPHYTDHQAAGFNGETRQMRIEEFMVIAPGTKVIGLQEGTALYLNHDSMTLWGDKEAYLFLAGNKTTLAADSDLSELLLT